MLKKTTKVEINEIENGKIIKEKSTKTKPFFKDNKCIHLYLD